MRSDKTDRPDELLAAGTEAVIPYSWHLGFQYVYHPIAHGFALCTLMIFIMYIPVVVLATSIVGLAEGKLQAILGFVGLFAAAAVGCYSLYAFRLGALQLTPLWMQLPFTNLIEMKGRLRRSWSEVTEITVADGPRLGYGLLGNVLSFGFSNGDRANIELWKVPVESLSDLCTALKTHCPDLMTDDLASRLFSRHLFEISNNASYAVRRFSKDKLPQALTVTSFTPLESGIPPGRACNVTRMVACGGDVALYEAEDKLGMKCRLYQISLSGYPEDERKDVVDALIERVELFTRLTHPGIVKIEEAFEQDNCFFFRCEHTTGVDLRQYVGRKRWLKPKVAVGILDEILELIDYLHESEPRLVLGSLNPESILVERTTAAFLLPLGGGVTVDGSLPVSTIPSRLGYVAPEQLTGAPVAQSDVYALGGILHFMLTGDDPEAMQASHPQIIRSSVHPLLDRLVADATEPRQDGRLSSVLEFRERLNEARAGQKGRCLR